jgi:alpha-mannosidase
MDAVSRLHASAADLEVPMSATGTAQREASAIPIVILVPHTHWDREWYQPFDQFLQRLVEMMDHLIEVLDGDERFHFHLDGQAAMIDDYLDVRPEREADIKRLAAAGRLSVGPWYTQMDEFLVSGESHLRNLERGRRRAFELSGSAEPVDGPAFGYLPDQFGHIGQMPQILRSAGIERAVVWRGVPAAIDRTAFRWESPDGSAVVTEYLAFGYSLGWEFAHQHDAEGIARALRGTFDLVRPFAVEDRVLVTVGADHAIPQADLAPLLDDGARMAGVAARFGSIASYLADAPTDGLPVWRGELRSASRAHLLPNVYSSRVHQKRERARLEALVERYAEPLAALIPGAAWPQVELDRIWRLLLWNGAHDSVCGCSVDQVARDVDDRYREVRRLAEGIAEGSLAMLARAVDGRPGDVVWFNPSPFERDGVPGLGWAVGGAERPGGPPRPVPLAVDGDRIVADDFELRLVNEGDVGDLYTWCPTDLARPVGTSRMKVDDAGAVTASFEGLQVRIAAERRDGEPFVRLSGTVRNERPDHRLRMHVALPARADRSVALSPFEIVERPLVGEADPGLEAPSPTWPARGAVLAGGLAVLSEGVIEYEVAGGVELAITLLRCVGSISHAPLSTRPSHAGPDIGTPDAQMIGEWSFELAVYPGASAADLLEAWERFALPLAQAGVPGEGGGVGDLPTNGSLLEVRGAQLSSVRRTDDGGFEVRIWNADANSIEAVVSGEAFDLRPFEIRTVAAATERRPAPG